MNCSLGLMLNLSACLTLTACTVAGPAKPNDPFYAPKLVPTEGRTPPLNGSLYTDSSSLDLFSDRKARRVGDIITIDLKEQTVSQKKANVGSSKASNYAMKNPTILGAPLGLGSVNLGTEAGSTNDFKGKGDAAQSNNLQGNITVTVTEILPNGTLVVRGEKWMTINRGDEYLRITGMVRPDDVGADNTVLSTRVANARISYSGTGAMADASETGWLGKFFNSGLWPF